jgi:hypothetical protein
MLDHLAGASNKFSLNALWVSLSAEGLVALALAVPVSMVLIAFAYRIARR